MIAVFGSQPGNGHSHVPLVKGRRRNYGGRHRDHALDIFIVAAFHKTVPEQTVSLGLRLRRGADRATVAGTLRINPVIADRVPPVELDALQYVGRQRRSECQFV